MPLDPAPNGQAGWQAEAEDALDEQLNRRRLVTLQKAAMQATATYRKRLNDINAALRRLTSGIELPGVEVPDVSIGDEHHGEPLISSEWDWLTQTLALKARKTYE